MNTENVLTIKPVARIKSDFPEKFGIPRQSGLVDSLATVIFEPDYRNPDALKGIEGYSHLWLIWGFSENEGAKPSPTVRPPRLGGNVRMGVFATRSPFRPNPLGLSSVKLLSVKKDTKNGIVLIISGADLMDGTPIYDIKPYLPITDCHPDASEGFSGEVKDFRLRVELPDGLASLLPEEKRAVVTELLAQDPRPAYQNDPTRLYGFFYAGFEIKFFVKDGLLTVTDIIPQ